MFGYVLAVVVVVFVAKKSISLGILLGKLLCDKLIPSASSK